MIGKAVMIMPKGISIVRWNNQLGPFIEISYPDNITLSPEKIIQLYTSQTMGDIATPRFSFFASEGLKIASYFGGIQDSSLLLLFLKEDEDPDFFKNSLIDAFMSMPQEKSLLESWAIQFLQKLKTLSPQEITIEFSQKLSEILHEIENRKISTLTPEFDFDVGIKFPQLADSLNKSGRELNRLLEQLANFGYLIREIHDCYYSCPDCNSARLQIKSTCKICDSSALERTLIIEHFVCGTQTIGNKFISSNGMRCPKCNIQLKTEGIDYSNSGLFYYCHKCKNFFNNPHKYLLCYNCGSKFPEENANLTSVIGYKVHQEKLNIFMSDPDTFVLEEVNRYP